MMSIATQVSEVRPNVLRSPTIANTLGGLDPPETTVGLRLRSRALVATASMGDLWRGPSEARWIARLLRGAPPPRDSAPPPRDPAPPPRDPAPPSPGLVAHG